MERYTYEIIFTRLDGQPDEIQQHTSEELARECFRLFDEPDSAEMYLSLIHISPLWSSEIEPFAIRVTTKRLPQVKHYGDVSVISGADLPPVDIITFGSPCQDMSIAGKRDGLDGSRSSLFYEAIRIVKEMRCKTNGERCV